MTIEEPCRIFAVVTDTSTFATSKLSVGDWVVLTQRRPPAGFGTARYRSHEYGGSWGTLGKNYKPIVNLETGELYD